VKETDESLITSLASQNQREILKEEVYQPMDQQTLILRKSDIEQDRIPEVSLNKCKILLLKKILKHLMRLIDLIKKSWEKKY
jgi:hypothetical protein